MKRSRNRRNGSGILLLPAFWRPLGHEIGARFEPHARITRRMRPSKSDGIFLMSRMPMDTSCSRSRSLIRGSWSME